MECKFCKGKCVKDGHQGNGTQRYKCKNCNKKQQAEYSYHAYGMNTNKFIVTFVKEGVGIRGAARILRISTTTLIKRILGIARQIIAPTIKPQTVYEVDEIKTFIKCKREHIWIAYALDRQEKSVACFAVGPRTNETLFQVLGKISDARCIYTDKLHQYKTLIHPAIHKTTNRGTNHIERHNLTIRTHIKRLTRKTICFSRTVAMLYAVLKIYFWG